MEFCPECGAPIFDEPHASGSDGAIYPELARANLLRMRGDYRAAEGVCLSLLRRFPNNATANGLLGDICAERGDLSASAEWYELALDLVPDDEALRQKLRNVKSRLEEHEALATAKQLGLPTARPRIAIAVGAAVIFLFATGIVAYVLGQRAERNRLPGGAEIGRPLTIKDEERAVPPVRTEDPDQSQSSPSQPAGMTETESAALSSLLAVLEADDPVRSASIDVRMDPRPDADAKALTITFQWSEPNVESEATAGRLGGAALRAMPALNGVTVRRLDGGKLVFVATVERFEDGVVFSEIWREGAPPNSVTNQPDAGGAGAEPAHPGAGGGSQPNPGR